jgi:hypothetical protein
LYGYIPRVKMLAKFEHALFFDVPQIGTAQHLHREGVVAPVLKWNVAAAEDVGVILCSEGAAAEENE